MAVSDDDVQVQKLRDTQIDSDRKRSRPLAGIAWFARRQGSGEGEPETVFSCRAGVTTIEGKERITEMSELEETHISKAILEAYYYKLADRITSDVIIVGAGPSGMTAGIYLARAGLKVTILEKRLAPGGGIWGGAIGMNEAVVQDEAISIMEDLDIGFKPASAGLFTVDTVEMAAGLCLRATKAGAVIFNLMTAEDVRIQWDRITGVVVNRTTIGETLPVDPITFSAGAVIDATGHQAVIANVLHRRGLLAVSSSGEGAMDAASSEVFVVDKVAEVFPGLWVCGMSTCALFGGPRMGPIFGGMLRSGRRAADLIRQAFDLAKPLLRIPVH